MVSPSSLLFLLAACGDPVPEGGVLLAEGGDDRLAFVGEPLTLSAEESPGAATYLWTFDGETVPGATVDVTFETPGRRQVYLEVKDGDGRAEVDVLTVSVVRRPLTTPPRVSASLTPSEDTQSLTVVMPDLNHLAIVDLATQTLLTQIPTCDDPRSVSAAEGLIAVACAGDDAVLVLDAASLRPLFTTRLPWGARPFGVVISPSAIWVTLQGEGALARISFDGAEVEILPVGPDLRGLGWSEGVLWVSRHRSAPDVSELWRVDEATGQITPFTLAFDPGPDSDTDSGGVVSWLQRVAIAPDGQTAAWGGLKANVARGEYLRGEALTFETTARAALRVTQLNDGVELGGPRFDNRDLIVAAAYSPFGDVLWAASLGAGILDALDPFTFERLGGVQGVDPGVDGLWLDGQGGLWVSSPLTRSIQRFEVSTLSDTTADPTRIDLRGALPEPLTDEELRGALLFHAAGDRRVSLDAYLSCASCHLDGDTDAQTWDFTDRGEGLRDTIPLYGLDPTAPIHWSGNFDEVHDFENDLRGPMGGEGLLDDEDYAECADALGAPKAGRSEDLDALAAYVLSLTDPPRSPARAEDGTFTEAALRGEVLFTSDTLGCVACHPPPTYTISAWLSPGEPLLVDVGTMTEASGQRRGAPLTGLDVPSLRGLHHSAPYLHDGRAASLHDVLGVENPEDQHGATSTLTSGERGDLMEFLLSLE